MSEPASFGAGARETEPLDGAGARRYLRSCGTSHPVGCAVGRRAAALVPASRLARAGAGGEALRSLGLLRRSLGSGLGRGSWHSGTGHRRRDCDVRRLRGRPQQRHRVPRWRGANLVFVSGYGRGRSGGVGAGRDDHRDLRNRSRNRCRTPVGSGRRPLRRSGDLAVLRLCSPAGDSPRTAVCVLCFRSCDEASSVGLSIRRIWPIS